MKNLNINVIYRNRCSLRDVLLYQYMYRNYIRKTYCNYFHEFRMSSLTHKFKAFYVGGYHKRFVIFDQKLETFVIYCNEYCISQGFCI